MSSIQVGNRQLTAESICQQISTSQLLPQLLRELIIARTLSQWQPIVPIQPEELERCYHQITALPTSQGLSELQLKTIATRTVKLHQFKLEVWGHKLGSYYLNRKSQLDRVVYSLLQVEDVSLAQELFFRIQSDAKAFAKLALKYSQGAAAIDGGRVGPVPRVKIHPALAARLFNLQPRQLSSLFKIDNLYTFVRLEELIPTQFDDRLRQVLLDELFERWLQQKIASEIGSISIRDLN